MLTFYWTAIFAHLQVQQAWLTPPHSTFCAICLHSALFVCTQLIFNALRSVCRGNIPTLLPTLPALLSALPTLLPALPTLLSALPTLLSALPTPPAHRSHKTQQHKGRVCRT